MVIIDDSDSEEEQESKKPNPKASVPQTRNPAFVPSNLSPVPPPTALPQNPLSSTAPTTSASPLLFDRLAMERERLERQKRLRGDVNAPASSSEDEDESQDVEKKDAGDERETKRRKLNTDAGISASTPIAVQRDVPAVSRPVVRAAELFLEGEVRPTWNAYAEGDTRKRFKIQDIMGDVSPIIHI